MNSNSFTSDSDQSNIAPKEINEETSQEIITNKETEATTEEVKHPIAEVVNKYIHKIRDIKYCSSNLIPLAQVLISKTYKYNMQKLDDGEKLIESEVEAEALYGRNQVEKAVREIERLLQSNIPETIESSLFLNLFATFDVFFRRTDKSIIYASTFNV